VRAALPSTAIASRRRFARVANPLIAATALHHNLVLVTGNTAHYQRLQALGYDLRLDDWRAE